MPLGVSQNCCCAGLYNRARTRVNACLPPETWQTYDIEFRAPRLNADDNVKENARITVYHNGVKVHDNGGIPQFCTLHFDFCVLKLAGGQFEIIIRQPL